MQKIIRRTCLAEAQVARRLAKQKDIVHRAERRTKKENDAYKANLLATDIKRAKKAFKEDYELGPLAPRRDVGSQKETYGTISSQLLRGRELSKEEKEELYRDTPVHVNIVRDDRVVLLDGRDKGKIGKVLSVNEETREVTVDGLNLVSITRSHTR